MRKEPNPPRSCFSAPIPRVAAVFGLGNEGLICGIRSKELAPSRPESLATRLRATRKSDAQRNAALTSQALIREGLVDWNEAQRNLVLL